MGRYRNDPPEPIAWYLQAGGKLPDCTCPARAVDHIERCPRGAGIWNRGYARLILPADWYRDLKDGL